MKETVRMLGLVLLCLVLLDTGVAGVLHWAETQNRLDSLVRYFDYGRSVPSKLARWQAEPDAPGNLYSVAWRSDILKQSAVAFAAETPDVGPVVRSYGMSFTDQIIAAAQDLDPDLLWDRHSGPGAPPNFTYALFQDDRANRRAGDIVVLGILASSVPMMAALGNRTWVFEQPAPFTYPVFRPDGVGLRRIEPRVTTRAEQDALAGDPVAARSWNNQLAAEDAFYSPLSFGACWLDVSPFARLVRRSLAMGQIHRTEAAILRRGTYPYAEVLRRMIADFARTARVDSQIPVVMLIQTRDPAYPDLHATVQPVLDQTGVAWFTTADHADPRDLSRFQIDGHYIPEVNAAFGKAFLALLSQL